MKKLISLVLALMMVVGMMGIALATTNPDAGTDPVDQQADTDTVSITVIRDADTYNGEAGADSREFTWYRVFTADYGTDFTGNSQKDGGYNADGTPKQPAGDTENPVSYTATPAVAAILGTIDSTTKAWTTKADNKWFDLTYIPGTGNYSVSWRDKDHTDADTVQAAAKWLVANEAYETKGTLTFNGSTGWTAENLTKGYYVLSSIAGDNLIAATTDINVKEKNDYPPVDKKQGDEDNQTQTDDDKKVAVGDVLTYTVKVTIPKTAKDGDKILVWDKASFGLTYNNDVSILEDSANVTANVNPAGTASFSGEGAVDGADWNKEITIDEDTVRGGTITFQFTMTVNKDAIVDTGRVNDSGVKYGNEDGNKPYPYESKPDEVKFKTYFAGIHKIDGENSGIELKDVEFTLKEKKGSTEVEFPVTLHEDGYYYYDANGSSTVKTDAEGMIKIRGLDDDGTYTLTETKNPNPGYNMLAAPVDLTLMEDTTKTVTYSKADAYAEGTTYYTKIGNVYTEATGVTSENFTNKIYFTKTETGTSAYDGTAKNEFDRVENNKGTILPSTGGIGTTMFYIIGAALVLGAGILLVTKRKMAVK